MCAASKVGMSQIENLEFWNRMASSGGIGTEATTRNPHIKQLEMRVLEKYIRRALASYGPETPTVIEIGCGNGWNTLYLAGVFPAARFIGLDYSENMIEQAHRNRERDGASNVDFRIGDARTFHPEVPVDIVFTDRCLINLMSFESQCAAIGNIAGFLPPGRYFLMLENSLQNYANQNRVRRTLGLPDRVPPSFNLFFDEQKLVPVLLESFSVEAIDDFGSLFDVVLYCMLPSKNLEGAVDYDHPLVEVAKQVCLDEMMYSAGAFGQYGQNRLFFLRRLEK